MPAFNTTDQSRDILRPGRIQLTIVCSLVLALSVSVFGAYRALTYASAPTAVPTGGAIQTGDIGDSAHAPDFLLTKAGGPQFQTSLTPIEELQVGQRVRADAPTDEVDRQFGDEVVPSEWRKLTLTAPKQDGTVADVVLLRPRWWIEQQKAEVDGRVLISVPECGIDGDATVHSIDPCPEVVSGPGRVITGTFRHRVSSGIELSVEGEERPIRCTGNHPFWSEDQGEFVRADALSVGSTLRNIPGLPQVVASRPLPGSTFVYNLEVHGTHVYHVGAQGILAHNSGDCTKKFYHGTDDLSAANIVEKGLDSDEMARINREFGEFRDDLGFHMTEVRDGVEGAESYALSQAGNRDRMAAIVEASWDDLKPFLRPRDDRPGEWFIPDDLFDLIPSGVFRLSPGSPFTP